VERREQNGRIFEARALSISSVAHLRESYDVAGGPALQNIVKAWEQMCNGFLGFVAQRYRLSEKFIEVVMRSNPNPNYYLAWSFADGPILFADPDRPKVFITA